MIRLDVAIANSLCCSRNTVSEVLKLAETHCLERPIPEALTNCDIEHLFYPGRGNNEGRRLPDYEYVYNELAKPGVTLSLLWAEYCVKCEAGLGQYGYVDSGLDISFGYISVGNTNPVYKGWYTYDLSNESSIPSDAIVTKIYLTDSENGAYWIGFYKMMAAAGQGIQLEQKIGQIDVMYSGDNELLAKQKWLIGGSIIAKSVTMLCGADGTYRGNKGETD